MKTMDFNIDIRRIQLDSLEQFIASSKEKVQGVLEALEWDSEAILKDNKFVTCSLDTNHKIPQKSADCHIRKCALRKEGYDLNELFLSEPLNDPKSSVTIDDHRKIEVLSSAHKSAASFKSGWNGQDPDPKTYERLMTTFSADERLALYDYAVKETIGPEVLPEYDVTHRKRDETKPLTYEEQLALERDAKRRRLKYKSVHTSRKSHTEVLREVIESQMGLYSEWLTEKPEEKPPKTPREPDERPMSRNSSTSSKSHRKEVKRELSDTESVTRSRRNSVENADKSRLNNHHDEEFRRKNFNDYKSRYKEEVRERFEVRREDFRRRERSRDQREYKHERFRRSRSRERRRIDDRRNGCSEYRS